MLWQRKAQINWKSVDGAFAKPRQLHLAKGCDGVDHCPVTGCKHVGFVSQIGCRKHVKTKHCWFYYFDEKSTLFSSPLTINELHEQGSKIVLCCLTDNDLLVCFHNGFKAAAAEENIANNRTFQLREL